MARPLRIEFPGAIYHVTSRGDRREPIYLDDDDRAAFLAVLAAAAVAPDRMSPTAAKGSATRSFSRSRRATRESSIS